MAKEKQPHINIKNKRATYEFRIAETFEAGIMLMGSEIKSIRAGQASMADSYCLFKKDELWIKSLHIAEYKQATHFNHEPTRMRKLLLNKRELKKLQRKVKEKGNTIVPVRLYLSERGFAKLEIGLATGKKLHDKRESIKQKDIKRDLDRNYKAY